jgi:cell fate (sporulation/competence/biofilm development) regulator YmcA (YheA/YmcA/DUF963 family)
MSSQFAAIALATMLSFFLGRTFGRIETTIALNQKIHLIVSAMRKVEKLATLRGEDVSKISVDELLRRTETQLQVKDDE